ncbi:MAG: DUF2085 domain-containing protein [Actinobacteria bacterium]|nr:DUF2085 domain-containing protein [Actinomycetota bacterium]
MMVLFVIMNFYRLFNSVGFAVCHQIKLRSLSYGGVYLPVCARDTGIYLGFFFTFMYLWATHRKKQNGLPGLWISLVAIIFVIIMAVDGFTSYMGIRETNNYIRLITGLITGMSLPIFIFPILNFQVWETSKDERILRGIWKRVGYYLLPAVMFLILNLNISFFKFILPALVTFSIYFSFVSVSLLVVTLLPWWNMKARGVKQMIFPVLVSMLLGVGELYVAAYIKILLNRLIG